MRDVLTGNYSKENRPVSCPVCDGDGIDPNGDPSKNKGVKPFCPRCSGDGCVPKSELEDKATMTNELKLTGVEDGWTKVDHKDGTDYVHTVKIAGTELELNTIAEATLTCSDYSFERDYFPSLLVEAPGWYNPPTD